MWRAALLLLLLTTTLPHLAPPPHTHAFTLKPQVQLTADYAPGKLMDFLVASQFYSLEAALSICQRQGLVAEQVGPKYRRRRERE